MFDLDDFRRRLIGTLTAPRESWAAEQAQAAALPALMIGYTLLLVIGSATPSGNGRAGKGRA
jgi:hypothetical protein